MVNHSSKKLGLVSGTLGALACGLLQVASIFRSSSSTAPLGFIFFPFWCLLAFALFFALAYGINYIRFQLYKDKIEFDFKLIATALFVFSVCGFLGTEMVTGFLVMRVISKIEKAKSSDEIVAIFNESSLGRNKFVLGAIAQSEIVSPELLDRIAHLEDPKLHDAMSSLFPVLGRNRKGLAVMRLVVLNQNVPTETVEYLAANTKQDYVLSTIAASSKTSDATLRRLIQHRNYLIDWGLAWNRNTPQDVLIQLLDREKDFSQRTTLETILRNPKASNDIKSKVRELLADYK